MLRASITDKTTKKKWPSGPVTLDNFDTTPANTLHSNVRCVDVYCDVGDVVRSSEPSTFNPVARSDVADFKFGEEKTLQSMRGTTGGNTTFRLRKGIHKQDENGNYPNRDPAKGGKKGGNTTARLGIGVHLVEDGVKVNAVKGGKKGGKNNIVVHIKKRKAPSGKGSSPSQIAYNLANGGKRCGEYAARVHCRTCNDLIDLHCNKVRFFGLRNKKGGCRNPMERHLEDKSTCRKTEGSRQDEVFENFQVLKHDVSGWKVRLE